MSKLYHYKACGLDYIYLVNGYKIHDTAYGAAVSVENADDLHETITLEIISSDLPIRGQEFRFLRAQLDLSQAGIGRLLRVSRPTVARWEGEPHDPIPGTADRALRFYCALKLRDDERIGKIIELLTEIDDLELKLAVAKKSTDRVFKRGRRHWRPDLQAA